MLQFNRLQTTTDSNFQTPETASPAQAVTTFVQLVIRQFPIICIVAAVTTSLAVLYLLVTPPSYTAEAKLIIDTKRNPIFQQNTPVGDIQTESAIVSSQVEVLKSEKIALLVVIGLRLMDDPEFIGVGRRLRGMLNTLINSFFESDAVDTPESRTRRALDTFQDRMIAKRV